MERAKIVYYISGHGYGHAVRSIQIIGQLILRGFSVTVKTAAPVFLFQEALGDRMAVLPEGFDVGLVQSDSIRFDLKKTRTALAALLSSAEETITREMAFLKEHGVAGVVCDIPFLPLEAAFRLGLPTIAVGNFSWDWIYAAYGRRDPSWGPLIVAIRNYYQRADLLLRLPFAGEMEAFPRAVDLPLVCRRSAQHPEEIRRGLGLPADRKIGLIGFHHLDLSEKAMDRLRGLADRYVFLIRDPLDWSSPLFRKVRVGEAPFIDLVRVADFVITKPGYGIVAYCLAHGLPLVYCERGEFPEYPLLVQGIRTWLPSRYMPRADLYAGRWGPYLDRFDPPEGSSPPPGLDGAEQAARKIAGWIQGQTLN